MPVNALSFVNSRRDIRAPTWSPLSSPEPPNQLSVFSPPDSHVLTTPSKPANPVNPLPPYKSLKSPKESKNVALSEEARRFLSDLDNYIPLGCLCSQALSTVANPPYPSTSEVQSWQETIELPSNIDPDTQNDLHLLTSAGWVRVFAKEHHGPHTLVLRIYVLAGDLGHRHVNRQSKRLAAALCSLVRNVDVSPRTWSGKWCRTKRSTFEMWAARDEGSLYYMFNKLPSPAPSTRSVKIDHNREALEDLLDPRARLTGLKSQLYPYQRRSAGLMLQRESETRLELDPRLEQRQAPDGSSYYYGPRDMLFFRNARLYESCHGGILAETMGLGKTLICLALILSTKGHLPRIPIQYERRAIRPRVGSLAEMAISSINRHSIPWRTHFSAIKESTGEEMTRCINLLHENPACYEIPIEPARWNRKTAVPPPKRLTLAPVTIIVVPGNLCSQWQAELRKHTLDGALNVLVMKSGKQELPPANQLMGYDVILFSRSRFEQENRDGSDDKGRRMSYKPLSCTCPYIGASRTRDCTCLREEDIYDSPLKHLHFLRIIIDEGHFFSSSNSVAAQVAEKLVTADHRWVVSGTPAKDLLGVEMDLVAADSSIGDSLNGVSPRQNILNQRRDFSNEDITGAVKSIGSIASHFLKVRPWAPDDVERPVDWESYIYRHEDLRKRTFSGFSHCLRRTLESLVVRTRPEDVERDIELPPLIHTTIRLEPSLYDKMTTNLFTLVLTANAVTSERTDADYLFHKSSARARYQLVHNLRQSAFFWTGFSEADIIAATQSGETYLEKDGTSCSLEDRMLLEDCINKAQIALSSTGWKALSRSHEIGLFVEHWPDTSVDFWTFDQSLHPMLVGVTQLLEAQQHVNRQASSVDPTEGLSGAGIRALAPLRSNNDASGTEAKPALVKMGIPSSGVTGEPMMKRRSSSSDTAANAARKASKQSFKRSPKQSPRQRLGQPSLPFKVTKAIEATVPRSSRARSPGPGKGSAESSLRPSATPDANTAISAALLPPGSDLLNTRIVGTTSAKLSYLVSRILKYHREEKILVFYDGDNIAYYVAQVLELFHIHHLIYAKSLTWAQRSDYVVKFDQDSHFRVLLMDVKQAAFGLNLSSASRVFFVNPVCRPDIEAQAIKRAHRIGQTRPVVVETLILVGTIEEQMFERAKRMTRAEHKDAKMLEDDGGIKDIIQCAKTMTIDEWETSGYGQLAVLEEPQQLWSRSEWPEWIGVKRETMLQQTLENIKKRRLRYIDTTDHNDTGKIADPNDEPPQSAEAQPPSKRVKRTKRPRIVLNDVTNHNGLGVVIDAHEDVLDPALFSPEDASQASASQSTLLNGNASTSRTSRSSVVRTPELLNNSPALSPRHYSLFGGPS